MKLLYITNGVTGVGGLERVLSIKANYFANKMNNEIHILTINEEGKSPFYHFSSDIKLHSISTKGSIVKYLIKYVCGLKKKVKEIEPHIISVCDDGLKGFFVPFFISKKIKIIYERHASILHNTTDSLSGKIKRYIMKHRIKYFSKFIVLTESNRKEWERKNVVVIPNPLSFYPENSSLLTNRKIIVVGSHSYIKGYDLLLQTWKIVSNSHPDWKLNIYGKIDDQKTYLKMATEMNLNQSVYFHPPSNNIQQAYLESSIMLLTSRSEGFGMVLIEAMACGLPCISFDCPYGPSDIIKDGEDGFLVETGDINKMTEKICFLIENKNERERMGKNAKENIKKYLPEKIMLQWNSLFLSLLQK